MIEGHVLSNVMMVALMSLCVLQRGKEISFRDGDIIMGTSSKSWGKMPYSDESSAMLIKDKFNDSKSAFKRALGHLMKEKKIVQEEVDITYRHGSAVDTAC